MTMFYGCTRDRRRQVYVSPTSKNTFHIKMLWDVVIYSYHIYIFVQSKTRPTLRWTHLGQSFRYMEWRKYAIGTVLSLLWEFIYWCKWSWTLRCLISPVKQLFLQSLIQADNKDPPPPRKKKKKKSLESTGHRWILDKGPIIRRACDAVIVV